MKTDNPETSNIFWRQTRFSHLSFREMLINQSVNVGLFVDEMSYEAQIVIEICFSIFFCSTFLAISESLLFLFLNISRISLFAARRRFLAQNSTKNSTQKSIPTFLEKVIDFNSLDIFFRI
jgi:hypothetical protein